MVKQNHRQTHPGSHHPKRGFRLLKPPPTDAPEAQKPRVFPRFRPKQRCFQGWCDPPLAEIRENTWVVRTNPREIRRYRRISRGYSRSSPGFERSRAGVHRPTPRVSERLDGVVRTIPCGNPDLGRDGTGDRHPKSADSAGVVSTTPGSKPLFRASVTMRIGEGQGASPGP